MKNQTLTLLILSALFTPGASPANASSSTQTITDLVGLLCLVKHACTFAAPWCPVNTPSTSGEPILKMCTSGTLSVKLIKDGRTLYSWSKDLTNSNLARPKHYESRLISVGDTIEADYELNNALCVLSPGPAYDHFGWEMKDIHITLQTGELKPNSQGYPSWHPRIIEESSSVVLPTTLALKPGISSSLIMQKQVMTPIY